MIREAFRQLHVHAVDLQAQRAAGQEDSLQQVSRRAQRFQIPDGLPRIGAPFPLCIFQSIQFLQDGKR